MKKKVSAALGFGIIMSSLASPVQADECLNAKGKIANNAQPGLNTLGVAALNMGGQKMKCAVSGDFQSNTPGVVNYRHTLVCDDKVGDGEAQSQVTFDTSFLSPQVPTGACPEGNPFGPFSFTFEEISIPDPDTARGSFVGVNAEESSFIIITGDYNCDGGINMKFNGMMCFTSTE